MPDSPPLPSRSVSIHLRLLIAASLVLACFLGLGGYALERAFRDSAETASQERLLGYVYALLAAAQEDAEGRLRLPVALPDPRFSNPDSGLYARVSGAEGAFNWRSPSLLGRGPFEFLETTAAGEKRFTRQGNGSQRFMVLNFGVVWEDDRGREIGYTFSVAEDSAPVQAELKAFRRALLLWLGGASLLLLLVQGAVLRWGLRPLRQVAGDLGKIESGEAEYLGGRYPRELTGLTGSINSLIRTGRASRDRYRNSLGDLAHSLKTPLAVLLGASESAGDRKLREAVQEQVPRMNDIVQNQLKRAAASGGSGLAGPVDAGAVVERLVGSLEKVYAGKQLACSAEIDPAVRFWGDEGDLFELAGNLLENAFKYGSSRIRVTVQSLEGQGERGMLLQVEDDGPGVAEDERERVLGRGNRADQRMPGQGIGLSVSNEIVGLYGGTLQIAGSPLGGAMIRVEIPLS
ncbi:MAG: ATP-binding protein [Sedimenticola sp.]